MPSSSQGYAQLLRRQPGVAARVVNPETFKPLGADEEGMLLIKGPNVMIGYLRGAT